MTDASSTAVVHDLATMNADELAALAQRLGMPVDQLRPPDYPDFRNGFGYRLQITAEENKVSKLGCDQIEFTCHALDEEGGVVKKARTKIWISYPFDTAEFRFKDADSRERAVRDFTTLLRLEGNGKYDAYASTVKEGNKTRYFTADAIELVGKDIAQAKANARIVALQEIHKRKQTPSIWVGADFYARYVLNEKDDKIFKNWYISGKPVDDVTYIYDKTQMMVRPSTGDAIVADDAETLF